MRHEHPDHGRPSGRVSGVSEGAGLPAPDRGRRCSGRSPAIADESGHRGPLTTEIALRWARLPERAARLYQARRLEVVRTLAGYLEPREPGTEVPARGLLGPAHARGPAFLYSEADIAALIEAARSLAPVDGLRPRTYATLIGLMACTGLRIGEALALGADDVDLEAGVLTVRQTKFHKSRLVPLHATAVGPLRDYAAARGPSVDRGSTDTTFFVVGGRPAVALRDRAAHVPRAAAKGHAGGRPDRPRAAAPPRPAAHVRLPPPAGLVRRRDATSTGPSTSSRPTWPRQGHRHLLVPDRRPGTAGAGRPALRAVRRPCPRRCPMTPTFDTLVQDFFCRRLIEQQGVSPRTVEAYRDTFRLLLAYLPQRLGKPVPALCLADLDAPTVLAFLDHLEAERGNGPADAKRPAGGPAFVRAVRRVARPDRLAARPAGAGHPGQAVTRSRCSGYLTREEMQAVLDAPDAATWAGQRDRVLLAVMYNTGARVSEVVGLRRGDLTDANARSLRIRGKGRKERVVPLWKQTAAALAAWSKRLDDRTGRPAVPERPRRAAEPVRVSRTGWPSPSSKAAEACPGLRGKSVSPHTIRHTTAMHLLQSGVDLTVIALWLGHESPETTHQYVEADLKMKEEVLTKAKGLSPGPTPYRPKGKLLEFLDNL